MNDQVAVQNLLRRKLSEFQARNPAFSVRAFAARLGLRPSATNEILKGQRRVSSRMAERLASALQLDPTERAEFLGKFPSRRRAPPKSSDQAGVLRLTSDQFEVISDWVHFAILNLVKTADADSTPEWMADRLGLTVPRARAAVNRLERLGLMKRDPSGTWVRTYARINTPDDVLDVSVQKSHLADMDLARQSLLRDPVDLRDFTSLTVAMAPETLPRAKEILRRAQDEIAELAAEIPATEVYRLTAYTFPLTRKPQRSPK